MTNIHNFLPTYKGIYAITDSKKQSPETLCACIEPVLRGGVRWLQYRDKETPLNQRLAKVQALVALCKAYEAICIVNDDPLLAKRGQAHGVHIGQHDGTIHGARAILGNAAIIGVTCHRSVTLAKRAAKQGANYVAFGRFYSSFTKPQAASAPLTILQRAKAQLTLPIVAIGGITLDNAQTLIDAGADMLALSHGLFTASDAQNTAQQLTTLFSDSDTGAPVQYESLTD